MAEKIPSVEDSLTDPVRPEVGRTSKLKKIHLWVAGGICLLAVGGILLTAPEKEKESASKRAAAAERERISNASIDLPGQPETVDALVNSQKGVGSEGKTAPGVRPSETPGALVPPSLTGTTKPVAAAPPAALPPVPQADGKPYYPGVSTPLPKEDDLKQKEADNKIKRDEQIRTAQIMAFDTGARPKEVPTAAAAIQAKMAEIEAGRQNNPAIAGANAKLQQIKAAQAEYMEMANSEAPGMPGQALSRGGSPGGQSDSNVRWQEAQQAKMAKSGNPLLTAERQLVPYVVGQGTIIPGTLITEINSDMPGQMTAIVSMDVYDSGRGEKLMIPMGSRLIGVYNNDIRPGQERVMAAFQRLIFPNGSSVNLQGMSLADAQGRSGSEDEVNNHFFRMFAASFMTAGLAALFESKNTPTVSYGYPSGNQTSGVTSAAGQILVDISRTINERNVRIPPTITIRQGHKFNIIVNKDIALSPYI